MAPLGMALWSLGLALAPSQALHALAVGGMGGLILAMLARVTLGHTGRALQPPAAMPWAFALLNLGCAARVFRPACCRRTGCCPWQADCGLWRSCYSPGATRRCCVVRGSTAIPVDQGLAADAAAPGSASRRSCASARRSAPGRDLPLRLLWVAARSMKSSLLATRSLALQVVELLLQVGAGFRGRVYCRCG